MARLVKYQLSGRGSRGVAILEPTVETLNGIEELLRWSMVEVPQKFPYYMHLLVQQMALINQGYARKMSFGPSDPSGRDTRLAWRTPSEGIRRISGRYYTGWKVRQMGMQWFRLYNDSREAYYIEFGISEVGWGEGRHVPARRIRRPVRKMSLRKTLEHMMRTQAYHRVWADIYADPRHRHRGKGFTQTVQGPAAGHSRWESVSARQAQSMSRGMGGRTGARAEIRRTAAGGFQIRRPVTGQGSYTGPKLGRRIP